MTLLMNDTFGVPRLAEDEVEPKRGRLESDEIEEFQIAQYSIAQGREYKESETVVPKML